MDNQQKEAIKWISYALRDISIQDFLEAKKSLMNAIKSLET
jgi:hypothetical protein